MKKLEIIIRPEKLEDLKDILTVSGVTGMMISNIMGFGNQMGYTHQYRVEEAIRIRTGEKGENAL